MKCHITARDCVSASTNYTRTHTHTPMVKYKARKKGRTGKHRGATELQFNNAFLSMAALAVGNVWCPKILKWAKRIYMIVESYIVSLRQTGGDRR